MATGHGGACLPERIYQAFFDYIPQGREREALAQVMQESWAFCVPRYFSNKLASF